jgi:hypothetical protein
VTGVLDSYAMPTTITPGGRKTITSKSSSAHQPRHWLVSSFYSLYCPWVCKDGCPHYNEPLKEIMFPYKNQLTQKGEIVVKPTAAKLRE